MHAASLVLLSIIAQTSALPAPPGAKDQARVLLKEGARFYQDGEFQRALERFTEAFQVFPSPKLLFNIGQTNRELGRTLDAVEAFERFLAESPEGVPELVAEAKRSLVEVAPKIGRMRIDCPLAGADITVDGKPVGRAPLASMIPVMPGSHQVTATQGGAAPDTRTVAVAAGTVETVTVRPRSLAEIDVASPWPAPTTDAPPRLAEVEAKRTVPAPPAETGWWLGRRWTWVAAGSTVAFATGAIIAGAMMQSKFDELRGSCGRGNPSFPGCNPSEVDAVRLRRNVANVFWGLAAAGAVATGVLFYVEGRPVTVVPMAGALTGLVAEVRY